MIVQRVRNSKNQGSQIKVVTRWQHIEEMPLAFKRLMSLLLQEGNKRKKEVNDA